MSYMEIKDFQERSAWLKTMVLGGSTIMSIIALIMSFIAISIPPTQVKVAGSALGSSGPKVNSRPAWMHNVTCVPGSTDTSGSVQAEIDQSGDFNIAIVFGQEFSSAPKSIMITAGNEYNSGVPWVYDMSKSRFGVGGKLLGIKSNITMILFHYQVFL